MYEETTASVKHQGILSGIFECCFGVRQSESISPYLFNLFLNDLDEALSVGQFQGINIGEINLKTLYIIYYYYMQMIYANDLALLSETREDLQVGLDILYDYCHRWKLSINAEETCMIIFRKKGNVTQHDHLFFGERRLNLLDKISYLGLTLSSRGEFAQTQSNLADRGYV